MATYKDAGVDIDAQDRALEQVKKMVRKTYTDGVLSDQGAFGGLFKLPKGLAEPVLVASADGVGTKLKIAFATGRHDTVGRDLVNHCINDILVQGARPLFFLDYLATGRLDPDVAADVIGGVAAACSDAGVALLGGETAEMPGFYADGEYDLAGFIVGVVDRREILDGSRVEAGDVLVGLPSTGLHTNGYSLARKILLDDPGVGPAEVLPELGGPIGDALLKVHRCYASEVLPLLERGLVHAMAHITGGGLTDNLPRVLPTGLRAAIKVGAWDIPPVFRVLAARGEIPEHDLWRTFNMGVGMVLIVSPKRLEPVLAELRSAGCPSFPMGNVVKGERGVEYDHPPDGYPSGLR
ncbi:MAG: phosphoribosylformylglycinamidine cyclo-ligase [Thermoanaerobaculales bacterium]|jgi:phosphoribosylformylglycinamidine cyclo-ligase|nr:phosphoribosylformylglycinamidine cyclo-ligase [Thermoanaerobaculales bacterium]